MSVANWRGIIGSSVILAMQVLAGCGKADKAAAAADTPPVVGSARSQPGLRLFQREVVPANDLAQITVQPVQWIRLATGDTAKTVIQDAVLSRDTLIVLDGGARQLAAYRASTGKELWRVGQRGPADGEFRAPVHVVRAGDSLFVTDREHPNQVSTFDIHGRFQRGFALLEHRALNDIAISGGRIFITILGSERGDTSHALVLIMDQNGNTVGRGCQRDPDVLKSQAAGRLLGVFASSGVVAHDGRVYCFQHATPVVQVLDTNGVAVRTVNEAPPFNAESKDGVFVMDRQRMFNYIGGTWKPLWLWAPTPNGFVSAYSGYDSVAQRPVYPIFSCENAAGQRRCAQAVLNLRPLKIIARDSILVVDELATGRDRLRVGIVRLRMP